VSIFENELCLYDIYEGQLPVTRYELEVTDITGFQYNYTIMKNEAQPCALSIETFMDVCGPWSINARSVNDFGYSDYIKHLTGI